MANKIDPWFKPSIFIYCLLPLIVFSADAYLDGLSANPIEDIQRFTGIWALNLLFITLAMTPLQMLTKSVLPVLIRRMLGVFSFFYAILHFMSYMVFDLSFDFAGLLDDLIDRPWILVGFICLVILLLLTLTSTNGWMRRLGKRWKQLHKLAYLALIAGCLHYLWLVKAELTEPLIYSSIAAFLLLWRVPVIQKKWIKPLLKAMHT